MEKEVKKKIMVTGISGQDGSILAEQLLEMGHEVYGLYRRSSSPHFENINHIKDKLNLICGDITDPTSVNDIFSAHHFDEVYNTAAQSFVGASFTQPHLTFDVDTIGVLNILEAIRKYSPDTKLYQCSTSEMFGSSFTDKDGEKYQDENTTFHPESPYAVAKVAAHHMCSLYRKAYGLYICSSILMNHECLKYDSPLFIQNNNMLDILPIQDIAEEFTEFTPNIDNKTGSTLNSKIKVWDKNGWTDIKCISWFNNIDKKLKIINSRNSVFTVSNDHKCFLEGMKEVKAEDICIGDKIEKIQYPDINQNKNITLEESELLGMLVGDGTTSSNYTFTNSDVLLRDRFNYLWSKCTNGNSKYYPSISGFTGNIVGRLDLSGGQEWLKKYSIYTSCVDVFGHKYKKIPYQILNSTLDIMEAFLIGYNSCDGLKKNRCKYRFKNFKTNSPTLAAGLLFLINKVTKQRYNITVDESSKHGKRQFYYSLNLLSDRKNRISKYNDINNILKIDNSVSVNEICRQTNFSKTFVSKVKNGYIPSEVTKLELCSTEIKKIITVDNYNGLFFDIETESNTFHAGVGQGLVHNSERRGVEFVTRKITDYIGKLVNNKTNEKLKLGNLEASRDWGHAADYTRAMYLIMQQDIPDDYVICTGVTHTIKEFLDEAFGYVNLDWKDYVVQDPQFNRPSEVPYLRGKYTKAKEKLGWEPKIDFKTLVHRMVDNDIRIHGEK